MGSSIFHKLFRTQSHSNAIRIVPHINKSFITPPPLPSTSEPRATSPLLTHFPVSQSTAFQIPFLAQSENGDPISNSNYFPSFSIAFFLNPNSYTGLAKNDTDGDVSADSLTIWADSVKKKRKKKMNKHKLRKLRKRLSRKT